MTNNELTGLLVAVAMFIFAAWNIGFARGWHAGRKKQAAEAAVVAAAAAAAMPDERPVVSAVTDWPLEIGEWFNYLGVSMVCVGRTTRQAALMAPVAIFHGMSLQDSFAAEYTCRDGIVRQAIFRREMWPALSLAAIAGRPTIPPIREEA